MFTSVSILGNTTNTDEDTATMSLPEIAANAEATKMNDPMEKSQNSYYTHPSPQSTSMIHHYPIPTYLASCIQIRQANDL